MIDTIIVQFNWLESRYSGFVIFKLLGSGWAKNPDSQIPIKVAKKQNKNLNCSLESENLKNDNTRISDDTETLDIQISRIGATNKVGNS